MTRTCEATRRDGHPCTIRVVGDSCFCFAHSPALREQREQAHRRGGQNRATAKRLAKIMPVRLLPVWDVLEQALSDVLDGRLDPKLATAAAAVARALASILQTGELEERVRQLEQRGM
jgi:hypothetical protein